MNRYIAVSDGSGAYVADTHRGGEECLKSRMATMASAKLEAAAMNRCYDGVIAAKIVIHDRCREIAGLAS